MKYFHLFSLLSGLLLLPFASPAKYIWTTFRRDSAKQLWVWSSPNATSWDLVKGPAYTPSTLFRDPSVILLNGIYYVAHTTDWYSTNFTIISSPNLLDWTIHTTVQITNSSITRTWAPELWRDPTTGKIHIIVSLGTNIPDFTTNLYTAKDESLLEWNGPVVMSGIPANYIDTVLVYHEGIYHAFTKGVPYLEHAIAHNIEGPYDLVQTGNFAGWGEAEGPSVLKLADGRWRLWGELYRQGKYIYSDSWDLYNWTATQEVPGLSGVIKHGTVIRIE